MSTGLHRDLEISELHRPYAFEYADATARTSATGLTALDVGKLARQLDDNSLWLLLAITPTWKDIGVSSADGDVVGPASATANALARYSGTTGKLIKNSSVTVDDSGNIATAGTVDGRDISADGGKLDGISTSAINATDHRSLAQLSHYLDEGPDASAYKEVLPAGSAFPTSVIWWTTSAKLIKVVEKTLSWSGAFPSIVTWKCYLAGVLQETITDTYDYTGGNLLTPKITRVLT
jgi:hypothetical protein